MTKSYQEYREKLLSEVSIGDLISAVDMLTSLAAAVPEPNEIADDARELAEEFDRKIVSFQIKETCSRCGGPLYLSDLPQYSSTCYCCEENFG